MGITNRPPSPLGCYDPMNEKRLGLILPVLGHGVGETVVPMARLAEDSGYTDIWSAELSGVDAFTPLAVIAASTQDLRLGTVIAQPSRSGYRRVGLIS